MSDWDEWLVNKEDLPEGIVEFNELLCGCGCPASCWELLHQYLKKCASDNFYYREGSPFELFFMYVVDHLGFTEHGTSINGAWITSKGKKTLAWLEQNIDDVYRLVIGY